MKGGSSTRIPRVIQAVLIVALFIAVSYFAQQYKEELAAVVEIGGAWSMLLFTLFIAAFTVLIVPLELSLLIPLGAVLWGPVPTALMSIIGWTLGSAIAFGLARRYGRTLVRRLVGLERVEELTRRVPPATFSTVVLLRLCVPVDLLSYALGLTSSLSWRTYLLATAIGVTPFGFFFAYAGALPLARQLIMITAGLALAALIFLFIRRRIAG